MLGVSGVGKSSIIKELLRKDSRFRYIKPYTTRPLRNNEKDKIQVSEAEAEAIILRGDYLIRNSLYGYEYITPKDIIYNALQDGLYPVLDFPLQRLSELKARFSGDLFTTYISPPCVETWKTRLSDGRDPDDLRLISGLTELAIIENSNFQCFDLKIINYSGQLSACADKIYYFYLNSCHS